MNNFKINGTDPDNIMSKGQQVDRIYSKGTLVWEKSFPEVTIGTQTWKVKNLDIDDGGGGIYAYNNDESNVATYGRLYTWDAAMRVAASIDGWHLPSDAEWTVLTDYLGGGSVAGGKLKETGTTHWKSPNTGATNESGFTALPGGLRYRNGTFGYIGFHGLWWSATERNATGAWYRNVYYHYSYVTRSYDNKEVGFSVRLIRDYSHTPTITLLGDSSITINVGDTYTDTGATAHDTRYGDITDDIVTVNNVNTSVAGTYIVTYNITTEDGYNAEEVVRTVVVEETEEWTYEGVMTVGVVDGLPFFEDFGWLNNVDYPIANYGTLNPLFDIIANVPQYVLTYTADYDIGQSGSSLYFGIEGNYTNTFLDTSVNVIVSINGNIFELPFISWGDLDPLIGRHTLSNIPNPFPAVGETCEIKLRYTLAEPEQEFEEVTIGTQTWTAVNLDIDDGGEGIYAYNNDENNVPIYGRLYTWDAAVRVAASVDGWHLPSDAEWATLTDYLGGEFVAGGKLKEVGTTHWNSPNEGATNESGFTALPGGLRYGNGTFFNVGSYGYWWSATEYSATHAWYRTMNYYASDVGRNYTIKEVGFSVRLIRD